MFRKVIYILGIVLVVFIIISAAGIRYFNNLWFNEKENHLSITSPFSPIDFEWSGNQYGEYFEPHDAILIPIRIYQLPYRFYLQFDTGAPSTIIYSQPLNSLKSLGIEWKEEIDNNHSYLEDFHFNINDNEIKINYTRVLTGYGSNFEAADTSEWIKLGTLGADFLSDKITMIDFKNQKIQLFTERPDWMKQQANFQPFSFKGRRIMLPAKINKRQQKLFYDSGSSAFGLITTKQRFKKYTNPTTNTIEYNANSWGSSLPIYHRATDKEMLIAKTTLPLKRVSYVNKYANFQGLLAPFSKIGGWLGNKPFTENTLILDTRKEEFVIIAPNN